MGHSQRDYQEAVQARGKAPPFRKSRIEVEIEDLRGKIDLNQQEKQAYFMISNDIQSRHI